MGVIEITIDSLRCNLLNKEWALILKDKRAERYLPIYIGQRQANIIEKLLLDSGRVDHAEFALSSASIDTIFCKVKAVIVNQFVNNVFYAKLLLTQNDGETLEVDCAPAKAIVHGIRAEAPIFADEVVFSKAAISVRA